MLQMKSMNIQFSITTLLLLTVIAALAIGLNRRERVESLPESVLHNTDKAILQRLRGDGLDIEQSHFCGNGHLATFSITETASNEFHITDVFIQNPNADRFVSTLIKLPEVHSLHVSASCHSSLTLGLTGLKSKDPALIESAIRNFLQLEDDFELQNLMTGSDNAR